MENYASQSVSAVIMMVFQYSNNPGKLCLKATITLSSQQDFKFYKDDCRFQHTIVSYWNV